MRADLEKAQALRQDMIRARSDTREIDNFIDYLTIYLADFEAAESDAKARESARFPKAPLDEDRDAS
jgi:hypothetical protein